MSHRFRILVAPLALLLCALASAPLRAQETPAAASGPRTISVSGEVLDAVTGSPIRDVVITLPGLGRKVATDAQGRFALQNIWPGTQKWVVSGLGYARWEEDVEATEDGAVFTVRILPRPEMLQEITVVADRFKVRRAAEARSVRVVERKDILGSAGPSAFEVVAHRAGVRPMVCPSGGNDYNCTTVRGRTVQPSVFIDDVRNPGGLEALRSLIPEELYLVESYAGGRAVRVYTNWYVEKMSQMGTRLPPLAWF